MLSVLFGALVQLSLQRLDWHLLQMFINYLERNSHSDLRGLKALLGVDTHKVQSPLWGFDLSRSSQFLDVFLLLMFGKRS